MDMRPTPRQQELIELAREAIRICGGRALLKRFPLERYLRDAQASSVMRPWTRGIATEATGESALRQARKRNGTYTKDREEKL